jgi:hypothetical protein
VGKEFLCPKSRTQLGSGGESCCEVVNEVAAEVSQTGLPRRGFGRTVPPRRGLGWYCLLVRCGLQCMCGNSWVWPSVRWCDGWVWSSVRLCDGWVWSSVAMNIKHIYCVVLRFRYSSTSFTVNARA